MSTEIEDTFSKSLFKDEIIKISNVVIFSFIICLNIINFCS